MKYIVQNQFKHLYYFAAVFAMPRTGRFSMNRVFFPYIQIHAILFVINGLNKLVMLNDFHLGIC